MEDTKIQWHPGVVAAMRLELREDREGLVFQEEYNLNTKPLEVDLLVIKKEPTAIIAMRSAASSGGITSWNISPRTTAST